jgi:hypothetical protein
LCAKTPSTCLAHGLKGTDMADMGRELTKVELEVIEHVKAMDENEHTSFMNTVLAVSRCYMHDSKYHALVCVHDGDSDFQMFGANVDKEEAHAMAMMAAISISVEPKPEQAH